MGIVDPLVAMAAACEQVRTGVVEEVELNFEDENAYHDGRSSTTSLQIVVRKEPWRPRIEV